MPRKSIFIVLSFCAALLGAQEPNAQLPKLNYDKVLGKNAQGWVEWLDGHENDQERKKAMLCLIAIFDSGTPAPPSAVKTLLDIHRDELQPDNQRWAIAALGSMGVKAREAVRDIQNALNNGRTPDAERAAACAALARIDPESAAVQRAIENAMHDPSREVRAAAIEGAVTIYPYDHSVLSALSRALMNPGDSRPAALALRCLGRAGAEALAGALERGDSITRSAAAEALGYMGEEAADSSGTLLKAFHRERDEQTRATMLLALAHLDKRNADVLFALIESATHPPATVRDRDVKSLPELFRHFVLSAGSAALPAFGRALRDGDPQVRAEAVALLARFNPAQDAVDLLAKAAEDHDSAVGLAAIKALDALGPLAATAHDALEALSNRNEIGRPAQRAAAVAALNVARVEGQPRYRSAWEILPEKQIIEMLKDSSAAVRQEAAEALRAAKADPGAAAGALIEALDDSDEHVRISAALSLARHGKYAKVAQGTFVQWLGSSNPPMRAAAIAALAGMGPDAQASIRAVVDTAMLPASDNDKEFQNALSVFLRVMGPDIVSTLTAQLKSEKDDVRVRAARILGSMGAVAVIAVPELIELCKSAVDSDAQAGFTALEKIGPISYPLAAPYLTGVVEGDLFAVRRKWAAYALGQIRVPCKEGEELKDCDKMKVVETLQRALLDPEESVKRGAHGALARIGAPALPRLREMLQLEGESPYWAVRVMARMHADPEQIIPRLVEITRFGHKPDERGTAAELMGEYAPQHTEMIPALLKVLTDREDFVARAAIRSLVPFGEKAIEPLHALLRDRNPLLRQRALEALEAVRDERKDL